MRYRVKDTDLWLDGRLLRQDEDYELSAESAVQAGRSLEAVPEERDIVTDDPIHHKGTKDTETNTKKRRA